MDTLPISSDVTPLRRKQPASYCVECDALPGECDHRGPRYLDDVVYERVETADPYKPMWRVPDHERERVDNPPRTWATPAQRGNVGADDQNPFRCVGCGAPLTTVARIRGYTYCSKRCREGGD